MKLQRYTSPLGCTLHTLGTTFRTFLALIVMMMVSTGAWGQTSDIADKYITNIGTASNTVSTAGWYLVYNGNNYLYDTGSSYSVGSRNPANYVQISSSNAGYLIYVSSNYSGDSNETKATLKSGLGGYLFFDVGLFSTSITSSSSSQTLSNDNGKIYYHNISYSFLRINKNALETTTRTNQATQFSFAPVTLKYRYQVQVNGVSGGGAIIDGQNVTHGQYGYSETKLTSETVTPIAVDGYDSSVSVSGYTITVTYTPRVSPTSIDVTPTTNDIYVGDSYNLTTTFTPTNCYKKLTYTGFDSNVVNVSSTGVVTGKSIGTTTITVTAYKVDGTTPAATKTVTVTVKDKCATPTITQNETSVTFDCSHPTSGVTIYYTTDGSTPSPSKGTQVIPGATVTISYNTTVKAIATAPGYDDSDVAEYFVSEKPAGDGSQASPYLLSSSSHLKFFQETVDGGKPGAFFKVTADFSAPSDYSSPTTAFSGNFDGGYFTIDGLTQPLVKSADGATIKNVILDNVSLTSSVTVSGTTCLGAIAAYATGNTKIYNCGVQASGSTFDEKGNLVSSSSTISGGDNTGSLVGYIAASSNVRVVNNYSYANVSGGQRTGGIVGNNQGTALTNANYTNTSHTAIVCNMFYGNLSGNTYVSPVYAGNHTSNVQNVNEYNFWRSRANVSYTYYNNQLAVDKNEFLNRFPFYRHILNTHRELAAIYLFGSRTDANVAEIGHWYNTKNKPDGLGGIDNPTPYPIIERWLTNTKRTTEDIKNNLPNTGNEYEGNLITAADRSGKTVGSNGYLRVNWTVHGKSGSIDLPITDMDSLNYDFTWGKVVLPFATELAEKDTYANICTGWKITGITGGTAGSLTNYNFSDRDCTAKDLYSNSNYIFAQGGNYIVPYGVTAITIEGNMAKAFYLRDASYDIGYSATYEGATAVGGNITGNYHGQTVYTSLSTLVNALSSTTNPHIQAIVLVGNYHYNQKVVGTCFSTGKAVSIMSVDEDNNQEPDYGWYSYHTTDRTTIPAMRFDFVPNIGIGMAARVTESNPYPTIGIWHPYGWFELTETCVSIMNECEIKDANYTTDRTT